MKYFIFKNIKNILTVSFLYIANSSFADSSMNFNFTNQIPDDDYKNIVTTIVNPTRFQFMSSSSPSSGKLIPLGISAGGGISYFNVPQSTIDSLNKYTDSSNNFPSTIIIPRFIGKIGLPGGLDLAVNYAKIPQSSIALSGLAAQYAFFNPKLLPISLALRVGYTQITGFIPFDANSTNAEALLGIPILIIRPYVGIGNNWSNASTSINSQTISLSKSASWSETYGIFGIQISALLGLDFEAQISSSQSIYNAKLSIEI
jgi:hypothetical protein